jgi:hypothetical protein
MPLPAEASPGGAPDPSDPYDWAVAHVNRRGPGDDPLWGFSNPTFGVVRAVIFDGPYAARLDDLNGDHREVCLEVFRRKGSEWEELLYADDAGYPDVGETTGHGWQNAHAFIVGRTRPGAEVTVQLLDERHTVQADAEGWWMFVRPAEPPPPSHFLTGASYLRVEPN